jgi:hypothetical protein
MLYIIGMIIGLGVMMSSAQKDDFVLDVLEIPVMSEEDDISRTRQIELVFYHDFKRYVSFGNNTNDVLQSGITMFEEAQHIFNRSEFIPRIELVLLDQVIFSEGDPYVPADNKCSDPESNGELDAGHIFSPFRDWKVTNGINEDIGVVLSGYKFCNALGVAYMNGACNKPWDVSLVQTHEMEDVILAHEIGHNIGFPHIACPRTHIMGNGFCQNCNHFSVCAIHKWAELYNTFPCLLESNTCHNN